MANKQIKETNVARKKPREIDPAFPVRKGRIDATQAPSPRYDPDDDDLGLLSADEYDIEDVGEIGPGLATDLMAPEGIEIISQTARMNSEGRIVVDVVIDLGPPGGATGYDIRIGRPAAGLNL